MDRREVDPHKGQRILEKRAAIVLKPRLVTESCNTCTCLPCQNCLNVLQSIGHDQQRIGLANGNLVRFWFWSWRFFFGWFFVGGGFGKRSLPSAGQLLI